VFVRRPANWHHATRRWIPHALPEPPPQIRNKRRVAGPITDRIGVIERHGQTSEALGNVRFDQQRTRAEL
jgi:hypothetical protein